MSKERDEPKKESWGTSIVNDISLAYSQVREAGIDVFQELADMDPERAAKEFPAAMEKTLNLGGGTFRGLMCGGPDYGTGSAMINVIGSIYPTLPKHVREIALHNVMGYLDGLNYPNAQSHVERVPEPHLLRDIIASRWLYWPGYKLYTDSLEEAATMTDFERNLATRLGIKSTDATGFRVPSIGWLGYALSRNETYNEAVVESFQRNHPEIVDRVQDMIAGLIVTQTVWHIGKARTKKETEPGYGAFIEEKLTHYIPSWRETIIEKTREEAWTWLPDNSPEGREHWQTIYEENKT